MPSHVWHVFVPTQPTQSWDQTRTNRNCTTTTTTCFVCRVSFLYPHRRQAPKDAGPGCAALFFSSLLPALGRHFRLSHRPAQRRGREELSQSSPARVDGATGPVSVTASQSWPIPDPESINRIKSSSRPPLPPPNTLCQDHEISRSGHPGVSRSSSMAVRKSRHLPGREKNKMSGPNPRQHTARP